MLNFFLINFLIGIQLVFAASGLYYSKPFGHIHLKPYANSTSVTTVSCGELLNINTAEKSDVQDWIPVSFADKKGFIFKGHTSSNMPDCMQSNYPVFYQALELDLTEIFLWGRLSDHMIEFESGK